MTKHLFFDGEMNDENMVAWAEKLDVCTKEGDDVVVFFSSPGGSESYKETLAHLFNSYPKGLKIVVVWEANSAAFCALCETRRTVEYQTMAYSAIHVASRTIETRDLRDKNSPDVFLMTRQGERNSLWLSKIQKFVTESQFYDLEQGKTVYLSGLEAQYIISNWKEV